MCGEALYSETGNLHSNYYYRQLEAYIFKTVLFKTKLNGGYAWKVCSVLPSPQALLAVCCPPKKATWRCELLSF